MYCRKYNTTCRFFFPRFPSLITLVAVPYNKIAGIDKDPKELFNDAKKKLDSVKTVLEDAKTMEELLNDCSGKNLNEVERLQALIDKAGLKDILVDEIGNDAYHQALRITDKGYKMVLKRDVDETMVNNYNAEWFKVGFVYRLS